jgi:hypothetical protein
MKARILIAGLAYAAAGFALSGFTQSSLMGQAKVRGPERVKWEYKIEAFPELKPDKLNNLGDEGWELVAVSEAPARYTHYYLKRQVQ